MNDEEKALQLALKAMTLVPRFLELRSQLLSEGYEDNAVMVAMLHACIAPSIEKEGRQETAGFLVQTGLLLSRDAKSN